MVKERLQVCNTREWWGTLTLTLNPCIALPGDKIMHPLLRKYKHTYNKHLHNVKRKKCFYFLYILVFMFLICLPLFPV